MAERAENVDRAAADWVARRDSQAWSPADQAALDRWLGEATEHRVAWLRLNAAWQAADALAPPAAAPGARRRAITGPRMIAAGLAAAVLAGALIAAPFLPRAYTTSVGGSRAEVLADGSRLELNTDTRLTVRQTDEARRVTLDRGEAYFTVSPEAARPFVVRAGDYAITAQGAAFAVRRQADQLLVAVERGRVSVRRRDLPPGAAQPVICTAGALLEARPEATRLVRAPSRLERLLAWRRGLVTFEDARLADVAAEFNRYNKTKLVITDPALAEARVGGAFRPTNLEAFIRILQGDLGVAAHREEGRILLAAG